MLLPNQLTVLRIILTPVFIWFFLQDGVWQKEVALAIFIIAALTDWYDGWLARKFNYITSWGKFWDPMADKILTAGAFFSFVYLGVLDLWMVILIMGRDFLVTAFRGYADAKDMSFPTSRYAKWKTAIQMVFLYYLLVLYCLHSTALLPIPEHWFDYLLSPKFIFYSMLFITFITVHSGYLYLSENKTLLKKLLSKEQ